MRRLGWMALFLPLAGCESTALEQRPRPNGDAGTNQDTNIAWEDFPGRLAEAHCSALERCCAAARLQFTWLDCQEETSGAYVTAFDPLLLLSVRYDPKAGAACVASVNRRFEGCRVDPLPETEAECAKVFSGTLGTSEPCDDDAECADVAAREAFCETPLGSGEATCQPRLAEAEMCLLEGCQSGLFCDIDTFTCQPLVTEGDCFLITDCAPEAFCSVDLRCEPKRASGAACVNDLECQSGLCSSESTCQSDLATPTRCTG